MANKHLTFLVNVLFTETDYGFFKNLIRGFIGNRRYFDIVRSVVLLRFRLLFEDFSILF